MPEPCCDVSQPSAMGSTYARATVFLATPRSAASARLEATGCPAPIALNGSRREWLPSHRQVPRRRGAPGRSPTRPSVVIRSLRACQCPWSLPVGQSYSSWVFGGVRDLVGVNAHDLLRARRTRWRGRARRTRRRGRARRSCRSRRTRRGCRTRRTSRVPGTCRACRSRGRGTRKAWAFATPVRHIFRVLLERWRTTLPRWEVGAGVEQIAGHVDLLALGSVGQTLRRRIGMALGRDDDRRRHSGEHPDSKAIDHEHSFIPSPCQD